MAVLNLFGMQAKRVNFILSITIEQSTTTKSISKSSKNILKALARLVNIWLNNVLRK